jgi:hypothetical protein
MLFFSFAAGTYTISPFDGDDNLSFGKISGVERSAFAAFGTGIGNEFNIIGTGIRMTGIKFNWKQRYLRIGLINETFGFASKLVSPGCH